LTVAGPRDNLATMARRTGSAKAKKARSRRSSPPPSSGFNYQPLD
jgi:hypothetical protein